MIFLTSIYYFSHQNDDIELKITRVFFFLPMFGYFRQCVWENICIFNNKLEYNKLPFLGM